MFSFLKNRKVTVNCYTDNQIVLENYSIRRASKLTPKWWQDLPREFFYTQDSVKRKGSTSKKCPGFLDLYSNSWVVPAWSDLLICTKKDGTYTYSFPSGHLKGIGVRTHNATQFLNGFKDYIHLKLICPWVLREKTGAKFIYIPATWSLLDDTKDLNILPGVLDFKNTIAVHINAMVPKQDAEYFIKAGQPLAHLVPLTEKNVDFKSHAVTRSEYEHISYNGHPCSYGKF